MRLNRQNTLIEDNLQPCAGMTPEEIQKKFVKAIEPYKEYIDQIQGALYLTNIPLFALLIGTVIAVFVIFGVLSAILPRTAVLLITIPLLELFYCFDAQKLVKKLFIELPEKQADAPDRIRSLEEIVAIFWKPALFIWRVGFFVYRTIVCPNVVDTITLILATIIVSLINKHLCLITICAILFVLALIAPAILIKTPVGESLKQLTQKKQKSE